MGNLKEVRFRITSVESTKQITSAMKMVSASKLRRAQNAILKLRPYAQKIQEILVDLDVEELSSSSSFSADKKKEHILIVAVSSNRGLCGAFNSNVNKTVQRIVEAKYVEQREKGNVHLLTIGKKSSEYFRDSEMPIVEKHDGIFDDLSFEKASIIAEKLMKWFDDGTYDQIEFVYNAFVNAATQSVVTEQYLPVENDDVEKKKEETSAKNEYIYEPSKEEILEYIIPKTLKIQFYKVLLDSFASEHGARMTAMHKATDNAESLIKELNLAYNKARQAAITNDIIEIVSGAEALNN